MPQWEGGKKEEHNCKTYFLAHVGLTFLSGEGYWILQAHFRMLAISVTYSQQNLLHKQGKNIMDWYAFANKFKLSPLVKLLCHRHF